MSKALQEELEQAIRNGELELVRELVKKGADLQRGLTSGRPALLEACYYRKQDLVEWILKQNVDIDAKDNEGLSALHITGTFQTNTKSLTSTWAWSDCSWRRVPKSIQKSTRKVKPHYIWRRG